MNKQKNIVLVISAIFLFLAAFGNWPYGFYTLLRIIVCASAIYVSWLAHVSEQRNIWVSVFFLIGILFNPFIPIHLERTMWKPIDYSVAMFMIISIGYLKLPQKEE